MTAWSKTWRAGLAATIFAALAACVVQELLVVAPWGCVSPCPATGDCVKTPLQKLRCR